MLPYSFSTVLNLILEGEGCAECAKDNWIVTAIAFWINDSNDAWRDGDVVVHLKAI